MRVLVVGGGGREHALAWKLAQSPGVTALFVAPGNAGTATVATNVSVAAMDLDGLVALAVREQIGLVVPGPEGPLVAGLADRMAAAGIRCVGPSAAAAQLEGSKAFTKMVADEAGIPTARWERFGNADAAHAFISRRGAPVVVKADGLAGGKGVVVATTLDEALAAADLALRDGPVVIEECLTGPEVSLFALCDGTTAVLLGTARDHKRVGDGDTGPNTGGMGAVSPIPGFDGEAALDAFVRPALRIMAGRGTPFRGVLFAGLMLTPDGPRLIEYNVRFGDPECQALMPLLDADLLALLLSACDGTLGAPVAWHTGASAAVVLAARGYPGPLDPDASSITGLDGLVFHGATRRDSDRLMAAGGRVLTVVGTGPDAAAARAAAYAGVAAVHWPGGFHRHDIGDGRA